MEQNDYLKMSEDGFAVFGCKKDCEGTVVIPEGVTWIRDDAFVGCTNLKEILVDENNLDYCSKDGVLYSKLMSILYVVPCCKDSIEIPEYVLVIKDHAFEGCSNLKSITIPDSVSVIGNHTFRDCTNLTSIKIPSSVTTVVRDTFSCCTSLKEILVDEQTPNYCSWDGALYAKDRKTLIAIPYGKDSIEIPDGVAEISDNAFEGCKSLTSIEIPSSVTKIGWVAFHGCTSLKSITIPEGVPVIWAGTFQGCTSLISITIPSSVATIQSWAFRRCTSLREIHLKHKNPKNFAEAFKDIDPSNVTIYVPKGSVKAYRNSIHYKSFKAIIEEE